MAKMRASLLPLPAQYATPRVEPARAGGLPSSCGGTSYQTTLPVAGSSATTVPTALLMYSRPPAMIGVFCQLVDPCASGNSAFNSSGTLDWRQAIFSPLIVFLLI